MATPPLVPMFDSVLQRMYERVGVDTVPVHLEATYGIAVGKVSQLDVGVFRIDRRDKGAPLVARLARQQAANHARMEEREKDAYGHLNGPTSDHSDH